MLYPFLAMLKVIVFHYYKNSNIYENKVAFMENKIVFVTEKETCLSFCHLLNVQLSRLTFACQVHRLHKVQARYSF